MKVLASPLKVRLILPAIMFCSSLVILAQETVTDATGNVYATVTIGKQIWATENLKTIRYNDGTPIPVITDQAEWSAYDEKKKPACCWYQNNDSNKVLYGALYNWYAVNTGKLAPRGWHVSTDAEWVTLQKYLMTSTGTHNETDDEQMIAKSMAATTGWAWSSTGDSGTIGMNLAANNRSGFSALPGGFRLVSGNFRNIGTTGRWWCATEFDSTRAWRYNLRYDSGFLNRDNYLKGCGFSVRLVKG